MVYTFARVGAATGMDVEDWYFQSRRWWVRLHEKGGKRHEMPAHHNLEEYMAAYIETAGIGNPKGYSIPYLAGTMEHSPGGGSNSRKCTS